MSFEETRVVTMEATMMGEAETGVVAVLAGMANIAKALKNSQTCWMSSSKQSTNNDHLLVGSDLSLA